MPSTERKLFCSPLVSVLNISPLECRSSIRIHATSSNRKSQALYHLSTDQAQYYLASMLEWEIALALDLALGHPLKIVQVGVSLKSNSGGTLESANIVYREIIERE